MNNNFARDHELQILFTRLYRLNSNSPLVDATNTETVAEYYLLENLTIGLIRDSNMDMRGYEPGIAERWWHSTPNSWSFKIRDNLRWSNGQAITLHEIKESLSRLKNSKSRHILYMKNLDEISADLHTNEIVLRFANPVNSGVLHELSLADSGLLHPLNLQYDWSVTSGPYTISSFNRELNEAHLELNKFCPPS
ncbi:MAG: hypothetical protein A2Z20_03120 [Bdellovibrionales bacterium RBG_16_40_8]|nr:MAG: hypothetical protein A2Z20_03120 [Bdellovibrionales bacterium RBG_16_40_8]